jgi:hypothetical protein
MDSTFFGESTGLYFYSAVFQGNMALLALTGVFVVFKLQHLKSNLQGIGERWRLFINHEMEKSYPSDVSIDFVSPETFRTTLENKHRALSYDTFVKSILDNEGFQRIEIEWQEHQRRITAVRKSFNVALCWTVAIIFLSLALMPLAGWLHKGFLREVAFFTATIVFNVVAITITSRFIIFTVREL